MKCIYLFVFWCLILVGTGQNGGHSINKDTVLRQATHFYFLCPYCKDIIGIVNKNIASNKTFNDIKKQANEICNVVLDMRGIKGHIVCPGIIDSFGPSVLYIATQITLNPEDVCQDLNYCPRDVDALPPKRTFLRQTHTHTNKTAKTRTQQKQGLGVGNTDGTRKTFSVLQITDVHIDIHYTVGTPTDCGIFICCYPEFNGTGSAGPFGDYNCDLPLKTFDVLLDAANNIQPRPEFILFTGDFPPHDIWEESWSSQLNRTYDLLMHMRQKLPGFNIYPTLGNHECYPESLYYQPQAGFKYLNLKTSEWWQHLFPIPPDQLKNIQYSLYYTVLVKPGLRILSFNSDYGYTINFYGLLNHKVPAYYEQMDFMEKTLHDARDNNEKVILIGHVPPGNIGNTFLEYGDFFTDIVSAYADVIVLTTFGHTHFDHFELVCNPKSHEDAVGVVLIAPSVTTEGEINPSFRVYHFDSQTFQLMDYDQYFLNITEANKSGKATVRKLYSAISEYSMSDLTPKSFLGLSNRFKTNDTLFKQYWGNYRAQNGLNAACDPACKHSMICKSQSASLRAYLQCVNRLT